MTSRWEVLEVICSENSWLLAPKWSRVFRGFLFVTGIVLPIVCHAITISKPPTIGGRLWQSGEIEEKLVFVLSGPSGWPMYPLLIYSMASLWLLLFHEAKYFERFWVRAGVFSGILISLWYHGILSIVITNGSITGSVIYFSSPLLLFVFIRFCRFIWSVVAYRFIPSVLLAAVCLVLFVKFGFLSLSLPITLLLAFAPAWSMLAYAFVSYRIVRWYPSGRQYSILHLFGITTWVASMMAACRYAILKSLVEYSKLPVNPPNCYIATAAAKGHPWCVGSRKIEQSNGTAFFENDQLTTFKAGEIALKTQIPAFHRWLRRYYDRYGLMFARHIKHPWQADIIYLSLKPLEWLTRGIIGVVIGRKHRLR